MSMMKRHVAALVARRNRELREDDPGKCPECGAPIQVQWSGVKCSSPDCNWWFCY